MASSLPPIEVPVVAKFINPITPSVGRIVHYRLSYWDAQKANKNHDNGAGPLIGNRHHPGDVVPLLVVRVWPDEYKTDQSICRDTVPDQEPEWTFPKSTFGINGQAFLDGSGSLWVTSAPQAEANGCWDWPERVQ